MCGVFCKGKESHFFLLRGSAEPANISPLSVQLIHSLGRDTGVCGGSVELLHYSEGWQDHAVEYLIPPNPVPILPPQHCQGMMCVQHV